MDRLHSMSHWINQGNRTAWDCDRTLPDAYFVPWWKRQAKPRRMIYKKDSLLLPLARLIWWQGWMDPRYLVTWGDSCYVLGLLLHFSMLRQRARSQEKTLFIRPGYWTRNLESPPFAWPYWAGRTKYDQMILFIKSAKSSSQ